MGEEKRFILFLILTMLIVVLTPPLWNRIAGRAPNPQPEQDAQVGAPDGDANEADPAEPANNNNDDKLAKANDVAQVREPVAAAAPPVKPDPNQPEPELTTNSLGSVNPEDGYRMKVELTN